MLKKKLFLKSIGKKNAYPEHPRNPERLLLIFFRKHPSPQAMTMSNKLSRRKKCTLNAQKKTMSEKLLKRKNCTLNAQKKNRCPSEGKAWQWASKKPYNKTVIWCCTGKLAPFTAQKVTCCRCSEEKLAPLMLKNECSNEKDALKKNMML